ncbi:MAG: hypothetical protein WCQ00_00780 [bacterium]
MSNRILKTKNKKKKAPNRESGQAVLIAVILTLAISTIILFGLSLPIADQVKNTSDYLTSKQSLLNSLTGDEEVLYRLNKGKIVPSVLSLSILNSNTGISIADVNSSTKEVISSSAYSLFARKTKTILSSNKDISFNYGAWLSSGGLRMDNSSVIHGDVFSLDGSLLLNTSLITGTLSTSTNSVNMPISDSDINGWKNQASSGIIINGGLDLNGKATSTIGAAKIIGNLKLDQSSVLTLGGPLYVTGNVELDNTSTVQLSPSYGSKSETIVVGGTIIMKNSAYLGGSGTLGSNIILVSESTNGCTNIDCTGGDPAISISNSALASAFLVAPYGAIYLSNTSNTKAVFANHLSMANSSSITYDPYLVNINFNSSTSTIWGINSLKEIE